MQDEPEGGGRGAALIGIVTEKAAGHGLQNPAGEHSLPQVGDHDGIGDVEGPGDKTAENEGR